MIRIEELVQYNAECLQVSSFRDYGPNGLQVAGKPMVQRLLTGVSACEALLTQAIAQNADVVLVHHGLFWQGDDPCIVGLRQRRLRCLLQHDINLLAYHLPLDAHPLLGNNARLGHLLGLAGAPTFGEQQLGWLAQESTPVSVGDVVARLHHVLSRLPLLIGESSRLVRRIAWCTGAAHRWLPEAAAAGAEVFITGEISEPTVHVAREMGIALIAAGHHATERYGVQALGEHLAERFGLWHQFMDIDNPV